MNIRYTARVVLLNKKNEVLLFKMQDNSIYNQNEGVLHNFWSTPGGKLKKNETFEEAAIREVEEETGFKNIKLLNYIWKRERELNWKGNDTLVVEKYFLSTVEESSINITNFTQEEVKAYKDYKWWSLEELKKTNETILPMNFYELINNIINKKNEVFPIYIK